jgi:chemotaxis protein CheD
MMKQVILGVGELGASREPGSVIKTFALGSCIAVVLFSPVTRSAGMVHVALPDSLTNPEKARERPGYFADTGIPPLLREMAALGNRPEGKGLTVKLIGGASIMDNNGVFNIGKRNLLAIKKILWGHGLGAIAEDVGGNYSRTVTVDVATGTVSVSCPGRGQWQV